MNREELAKMLDGSEYPLRIDKNFEEEIKYYGFVVVFGASDDLMEFRGEINDELDAYEGQTAFLTSNGLLVNECAEGDSCPYFQEKKKAATAIKALWCKEDNLSWTYETEIPHDTFIIKEGEDSYCRGIVFNLTDVK